MLKILKKLHKPLQSKGWVSINLCKGVEYFPYVTRYKVCSVYVGKNSQKWVLLVFYVLLSVLVLCIFVSSFRCFKKVQL